MGNEELSNYIVIDQGIRFGKPCIKGTRITVGDILQWLAEGITVSEILDDYPSIKGNAHTGGIGFCGTA